MDSLCIENSDHLGVDRTLLLAVSSRMFQNHGTGMCTCSLFGAVESLSDI